MKRALLPLSLLATPALAQDAVDPQTLPLSPIMEVILARGIDAAADQLGIYLERYGDGSQIVIAEIAAGAPVQTASDRANKVAAYLAADLDWDGVVTREELEVFHADNGPDFVDGYLRDGDLDGDGQITVAEMRQDALAEYPGDAPTTDGILTELLGWDLDGDGILTGDELVTVIVAKAG